MEEFVVLRQAGIPNLTALRTGGSSVQKPSISSLKVDYIQYSTPVSEANLYNIQYIKNDSL